ncbi:MAG: hypothetical protein Q7T35_00725 [Nitrosomonas sp.]|nr:hypothetical protein [Nitrosomonas sp.]
MDIDRVMTTKVCVLIVSAMIGGCSALPQNQAFATAAGAVIGGGAGYAIGEAIGGKYARIIAPAAGVVVGGLIGNQIAQYLDERDRQVASKATQDALDTPMPSDTSENSGQRTTIAWNSDHNSGVRGRTTIVNAGYDTSGRECRAAEEVAYVGGREIKEQVSYCRDSNSGAWMKSA